MKSKKCKVFEVIITSLVIMFIVSTTVLADVNVSSHVKIYGKVWRSVYTGKMDSYSNELTIRVTDINNADNEDSDYKRVRGRVAYNSGGTLSICSSEVTLEVKSDTLIRLTSYYGKGTKMTLGMKGNNPNLDAYVAFKVLGLSD